MSTNISLHEARDFRKIVLKKAPKSRNPGGDRILMASWAYAMFALEWWRSHKGNERKSKAINDRVQAQGARRTKSINFRRSHATKASLRGVERKPPQQEAAGAGCGRWQRKHYATTTRPTYSDWKFGTRWSLKLGTASAKKSKPWNQFRGPFLPPKNGVAFE